METFNHSDFVNTIKTNELEKVKSYVEKFKDSIDINQIDEDGNTALMNACGNEDSEGSDIIKLLVKNFKDSIDINRTNNEGNTALMIYSKVPKYYDLDNTRKFLIKNFKHSIDFEKKNIKGEKITDFEDYSHDQTYYYLSKFKSIDTIFIKVGGIVQCYSLNNTIQYNKQDIKKDNKKLLLNVDTCNDYTTTRGDDDGATILYSK